MQAHETHTSVLQRLRVPKILNACGIYTDLGGACLSATVWSRLNEINSSYASLPSLLDRTGVAIAELVGAEAARVTPGASAGIALAVAACIARGNGEVSEVLPEPGDAPNEVILQAGHAYRYARCAKLGGGSLRTIGTPDAKANELRRAINENTAAVLFPAHLDGADGTLPLEATVAVATQEGVPVIVDAAYMSYPTELMRRYTDLGADLACFSAKYFYGPNAGGFVTGTLAAVEQLAAVDFTEYESGPHEHFGRALKMDRTTVVATWLALEEWLAMDHDARWERYGVRVGRLAQALKTLSYVDMRPACFTLENTLAEGPVNSLALRPTAGGPSVSSVLEALLSGDPPVCCSEVDETIVLCLETVPEESDDLLASALKRAWLSASSAHDRGTLG